MIQETKQEIKTQNYSFELRFEIVVDQAKRPAPTSNLLADQLQTASAILRHEEAWLPPLVLKAGAKTCRTAFEHGDCFRPAERPVDSLILLSPKTKKKITTTKKQSCNENLEQ